MVRSLWALLGLFALALATVGIVTPVLPTAPFLLLAAYCFARSSERLHNWLLSHPILGPPIMDWNRSGAISRQAKAIASASMIAALGLSLVLGLRPMILIVQCALLIAVAVFIWTRPEA